MEAKRSVKSQKLFYMNTESPAGPSPGKSWRRCE